MNRLILCAFALLLTACGGSYSVTRSVAPAPRHIQAVAVSASVDNSQEVKGYMDDALMQQGLQLKLPLAPGVRQSLDVDAIVTFDEEWGWDIKTILNSLKINMYDAASGSLLAKGEWDRAWLHDFERGKDASRILLQQMLEKIRAK